MSSKIEIPNPVIGAVSQVLGGCYTHTRINSLFMEAGAPGDPPNANCVNKCALWFRRCNEDPNIDALAVLGLVLQSFMDKEVDKSSPSIWAQGQERIQRALARCGLSYRSGGRVLRAGVSPSTRTLADMLRASDYASVDAEFERAIASVESDPPAGITAASSLIEALCKTIIEDEGLTPPSKQSISNLWWVVCDHLKLGPQSVENDDMRRILSGLVSIVDGVGSLRTHAGSAHGRGRSSPSMGPREARLAIHAAHTLAVYAMEVWHERG